MTTTCQLCGSDSQAKICWLCETEAKGGYVYYDAAKDGKIVMWGVMQDDFTKKIEAKDFCDLVRKQYPRGNRR